MGLHTVSFPFSLTKIVPKLSGWFLNQAGEAYSFASVEGKDSYSHKERMKGVERLSHLGLFGTHSLIPTFATDSEPFFFLESKVDADGLLVPALHFAVRPAEVFRKPSSTIYFAKVACDKISIVVTPRVDSPKVSFVYNLSSVLEQEAQLRSILSRLSRSDWNEDEVVTLVGEGEVYMSKKALFTRVSALLSSPSEYMRDHFVTKVTLRLPIDTYQSESVFEILEESFARVKKHTGRVSRSQRE